MYAQEVGSPFSVHPLRSLDIFTCIAIFTTSVYELYENVVWCCCDTIFMGRIGGDIHFYALLKLGSGSSQGQVK